MQTYEYSEELSAASKKNLQKLILSQFVSHKTVEDCWACCLLVIMLHLDELLLYKERDESKENLVYVDESGIDTYLYREYARAPRGKKIREEVSGRKFARQSIVAAKRGDEILAPFGYTGTCYAKLFNFWLKTCWSRGLSQVRS